MPKFTYKGQTKDGVTVEKTVDVVDRYDVYEIARENEHEIFSIDEIKEFSIRSILSFKKLNVLVSTIKQDELVMFTRNISAMLKAGLALTRALSVAERQTKNPKLNHVIIVVKEQVSKGDQFHEALAEHPRVFSKLYVAMVRAGEEGGNLTEALETISIQMHRSSDLKKKIKGAMIYPAIVISVMFIIGVLMMIYVVPTLTKTFKELDADLPASTKFIIGVSDFLSGSPALALLSFLATLLAFVGLARTNFGKRGFEWVVLHLPVIGTLSKEMNSARTARTLSSLLSSGVDVVSALQITKDVVQNSYYKEVIDSAAIRVEKGKPLSEAFKEKLNLYPVLVGEMIAVGEETGQISNMLSEIADFYEMEVERKTKDLSTIIEPVLMVVIGGGVGFFALAMITPIYSISDSI